MSFVNILIKCGNFRAIFTFSEFFLENERFNQHSKDVLKAPFVDVYIERMVSLRIFLGIFLGVSCFESAVVEWSFKGKIY